MVVISIPQFPSFDVKIPLAVFLAGVVAMAMTTVSIPLTIFQTLTFAEASAGQYLMQEYGLSEDEAVRALSLQSDSISTASQIKYDLGQQFLTAEVNPLTGGLTVYVADAAAAQAVRSLDVTPIVVSPIPEISKLIPKLERALTEMGLSGYFVAVNATKTGIYLELPLTTAATVAADVKSLENSLNAPIEVVVAESPQLAHSSSENHEHIRAGQKIYPVGGGGNCSAAFNLKSNSDSDSYFLMTAGHCEPDSGKFRLVNRSIGEMVERSAPWSDGRFEEGDWGVVEISNPHVQPRSTVYRNEDVQIDTVMDPIVSGATVCQTAAKTGTNCGEIKGNWNVGELNERVSTTICETQRGDSGGAVYTPEGEAVGVISAFVPCGSDFARTLGTSMAILNSHLDYRIY